MKQKILDADVVDLLLPMEMVLNSNQIAGIDEVGRGSLFGPVFAGAVLLNETTKMLFFANVCLSILAQLSCVSISAKN